MKDNKLLTVILIVVLVAIISIVGGVILFKKSSEGVIGKYNCKPYSATGDSNSYTISIHLNSDKSFLYGPYNNLKNNHYKGVYSYEKEDKDLNDMDYYMVTFKGTELMQEGKVSDNKDFNSKMEFAMVKGKKKKEGIIIFTTSYNMYYCYEE